MLIRQKAGWRLHHQAYLWPRRSRASAVLPSLPASLLLLPRRRRSGASSGSSAAQSGDDSSSSPSSLRRSSSCSSGLEGEETWPPSPASFFSSRSRKDSNGGLDNSPSSSSSSVASSFGPISSPRKKRAPGFAGLVSDQTQPVSIFSGPFTRRSRRISSSSDPSLDESPSQFSSKPGRRSSGGPSVSDGAVGCAGLTAAADARRTSSRTSVAAVVAPAGQTGGSDDQHMETGGHGRSESAVRTRRDARSADSKITESSPSCNGDLTCYSSLKGSSNNNNNNINNNNNHGLNCSSQHALSNKGGNAHEDGCLNGLSKSCWLSTTARMGVQCPEKPTEKCSCGGTPSDSPMQAALPPLAPFPSVNCGQDNTTSRKQTAEVSVSGGPAIRRRAQRPQLVGSTSVQLENAMTSESYRLDLADIAGHQNGFHVEAGLNGMRSCENPEKSIKSICCFTIEGRSGCKKCPPSRLSGIATTLAPSSLFASTSTSTSTSQQTTSVLNPSHGARSRSNSHGNANSGTAPTLPSQVQTIAFDIGSKPVSSESIRAKYPQHSSSLSSSAVPASSQQQSIYQLSQGSQSLFLGSISSSIDKTGAVSSSSLSAKSASASSKATVLNQRHRSHSGNSAQKSLLSSTETSPLPSSRFKASPSSTTLATEPASPQPSKARCKWRGCSCELDASDLLEHVRKHVEAQIEKKTYACLWSDCKVFNKPSWSCSWLERHIVTHSGHRPFKCILDNCGQRFHTQAALERHVNGHFTANSQNGVKSGRGRDDISFRAQQKRRRQLKRRYVQTVKTNDFIDEHTMTVVRHELHSLAAYTQLDLAGIALHTTFRTLIIGRRSTESGSKHSLLEFVPSDVLEDKWVPEKDAQGMSEISIPMSRLPADTVTNLHDNLYRQHRFRKHRRK